MNSGVNKHKKRAVHLFLRKGPSNIGNGVNLSFEALTDSNPSMCGNTEYYGPFLVFDIDEIPSVSRKIDLGVYDTVIIHTKQAFINEEIDPFIGKPLGEIRKKYNVVLKKPVYLSL